MGKPVKHEAYAIAFSRVMRIPSSTIICVCASPFTADEASNYGNAYRRNYNMKCVTWIFELLGTDKFRACSRIRVLAGLRLPHKVHTWATSSGHIIHDDFPDTHLRANIQSHCYKLPCPWKTFILHMLGWALSLDMDSLPYINPKNDRRVALITAGNSGIGYFTVLHLYLHGYVVYIAGRSKTRGMKSIENLKKEAKHTAGRYSRPERLSRFFGELHFLEMDLSSLASVLEAVAHFITCEKNLNLLINNAGNSFLPYTTTPDGFELQLQTNYVAPFLLTTKLLPLMEKTVDFHPEAGPPRIIYITSVTHRFVLRYFNLSTRFHYRPNALFTWIRYALAKTAGIHFMKMLALRNPRLICASVQPGIVMSTNYFAYWTRLPIIGILFWCLFQLFSFIFGTSIEKGAQAVFKCCVDPALTPRNNSGSHYDLFKETLPASVASNMDYAAQSWIWTTHQLEKRNIEFS